jgi:hypothetical protein
MNRKIVILRSIYKDRETDIRCFDSVSACAIYFAHKARRQYAEQGLEGEDLFDAVVKDVALLSASYDSTTREDPEEVHGGDKDTNYSCELHSCADANTAIADARVEDELNWEIRDEAKK